MNHQTTKLAILLLAVASAATPQATMPTVNWPSLDEITSQSGKPLDKAGLSAAELKVVRAALTKLAEGEGCQGANIQSGGATESLFLAKVKIRTDGDAAVALRATSACGTAGCPMWFIETSGGTVLIEDFGWGYLVLPSHEHGYFNVVTASGNHEVSLVLWSFDGHRYRPLRCASTEATDEQGVRSQISEHTCPSSTP